MLYREECNHGLCYQGFSNVFEEETCKILGSIPYRLCSYISSLFAYYTAYAFIRRGLLGK